MKTKYKFNTRVIFEDSFGTYEGVITDYRLQRSWLTPWRSEVYYLVQTYKINGIPHDALVEAKESELRLALSSTKKSSGVVVRLEKKDD